MSDSRKLAIASKRASFALAFVIQLLWPDFDHYERDILLFAASLIVNALYSQRRRQTIFNVKNSKQIDRFDLRFPLDIK